MTKQTNPIGQMIIDLRFTVDQVNEILQTLSHLPFHQVAPVMRMIQDQAIPQAQKHEEAVAKIVDVMAKSNETEEV